MPEHVSHTWSGDSAWIRPDGVVLDFGTDGTHMAHVVDNPQLFVFKDGKTTFADYMAKRPNEYDWGSEEIYRLLFSHGYVRLGKNYAYGAHTRRAANAIWDFFSKHYHRDKDRVFHIELGSGNDAWLRVEQILGGALYDLVESRSFRALVEQVFAESYLAQGWWIQPNGVEHVVRSGEEHAIWAIDNWTVTGLPDPEPYPGLDDYPYTEDDIWGHLIVRRGWLRARNYSTLDKGLHFTVSKWDEKTYNKMQSFAANHPEFRGTGVDVAEFQGYVSAPTHFKIPYDDLLSKDFRDVKVTY